MGETFQIQGPAEPSLVWKGLEEDAGAFKSLPFDAQYPTQDPLE